MARPVTLAALRTRARQFADQVNSGFLADTGELDLWTQESVAALHARLVDLDPYRFGTSANLTSTDTTFTTWDLPADMYKLLRITHLLNSWRYPLPAISFDEFTRRTNVTPNSAWPPGYILIGNTVRFGPRLASATPAPVIWYVPIAPAVNEAGTITFDGADGWDHWVALDVAIKMLRKEEADVSPYERERDGPAWAAILSQAPVRDIGEPAKIVDTYMDGVFWPPRLPPA